MASLAKRPPPATPLDCEQAYDKAIRQRLKDDFIHYAAKCLKVRSESGEIKPLILNREQRYIHERIEAQRGQTGKVRALILKGRQQGCCLSPNSKILMADYKWKTLEDIAIGDLIVACDENPHGETKAGRKHSRKFRTATVEFKQEFIKHTFEVLLDNGARLVITGDHRMLCKKRGGDDAQWRLVSNFKVGDQIRVACRPPNYIPTYEDGWFGGIIDGEGSARLKGAKRISVHQVEGPVLQRMRKYLADIDIPYKTVIDARTDGINKLGRKPVYRLDIHRMPYLMELLSRCRPSRFTNDKWHEGHELPGKAAQDGIKPWAKIISIKPLGNQRVIDLQTSEKTFICEGLVSHNSTYVGARYYHRTSHTFGLQAFILTHALDATANLYRMAQRYYENTPPPVKPTVTTNNTKELIFGNLDSGYKVGTAENKSVGRSSTIQLFHGSEVAFWANAIEHTKGIMQAIPDAPGTEVILESTANGVGNFFHQAWQKAEAGLSEYIAIFVPWYWHEQYVKTPPADFSPTADELLLVEQYGLTNEQLAWRRNKIVELSVSGVDGEKGFFQEYPCNSTEAFQLTGEDSFVDSFSVMRARKCTAEKFGPLIIGVDPARFGDDRTCIIRRRGRCAYGLNTYSKKDTMEITGIVHRLIEDEKPFRVMVDIGGLGAGIVDRLNELGHRDIVVGVNAGSKPYDATKYFNKRAEMWGTLKEWLEDTPCQIPDDDSLHADLCGLKYKFDSNSRLRMEGKDDAKKRGVRSPDSADALCLTLAIPSSVYESAAKQSSVSKRLANNFKAQLDAIKKTLGSQYA